MQWMMLTVLQANAAAFKLYESLRYTLDSTSPGIVEPTEECGYEIMSKARCRSPPARELWTACCRAAWSLQCAATSRPHLVCLSSSSHRC